ncbi:MAG: AraC family ligand binding domain-containing protein, partial [Phycisphaerales bacterium]
MKSFGDHFFRYVPVRPRDLRWGLYVTGAGCTSILPNTHYPPEPHPELYHFDWAQGRTLPEYQAIYITHGEGVFESAPTGVEEITPGTVILLFPGVWHRYRPQPKIGWDEWWVSFSGEAMDQLVAGQFFSPHRAVLRTGLDEDIQSPFRALLDRLRNERTGFPHLVAADVTEILAAVSALAEPEATELIEQGPRDVAAVKDRMVAEA